MSEELGKICRVCLSEGSRDIFYNRNTNTETVSSLDRIVEKYRFVTMLQTHEADCLPRMLCDTCIVSLNVAYNFKKRAIDADSKLRQYVIEKGLGLPDPGYDTGYNLAITDGRGSSSVSNFLEATHALGGFAVPEPLRQSSLHPETTALAHEYLRNFETPQSMASTSVPHVKTNNSMTDRFRCMPIQIKVEQIDPSTYQISPTGSEENLQTVSDTSSIRSAMNRIQTGNNTNLLASVSDHLAHCSDEEFVNHYLRPSQEKNKTKQSDSEKSPASSKSSGTNKSSNTNKSSGTNKSSNTNKSSTTAETESTNSSSTTNTQDTKDKKQVSSDAEKLKKPSLQTVKLTVSNTETEKPKTKDSNEKSKEQNESKNSKKRNRDLKNLGDTPVLSSRKRTQANKFTSDEPSEKKSRNASVKPRNRSQVSTETKSENSNKRGARNSTRKTSTGKTTTEKKTPQRNKSSAKKTDANTEKNIKSRKPKSDTKVTKPPNHGKGVATPKKLSQRS